MPIFILFLFFANAVLAADIDVMKEVVLPFNSFGNRANYSDLKPKMLDGFGAYRIAGHKHAGLDIKGEFNEPVYPIGLGMVREIYGAFPYTTVLIEHHLPSNEIVYSGYTHLENIEVTVDQIVTQNTKLGRLFSEEELKKANFYANHIHFEIRKTLERFQGISIKCFSQQDLNKYFYDPAIFLKTQMRSNN